MSDKWRKEISSIVGSREFWSTTDILRSALGFEIEDLSAVARHRVSEIMRDLGYESGKSEDNGKWRTGWRKK